MKKALNSILAIVMGGFLTLAPVAVSAPVFADDSCGVETSIIHCNSGPEEGNSIKEILQNVVNFLSIGIGILGVIGITVVGIQYLTAGSNEEQTRKAKRRLFEIIIGLAAYFLMFGILNWLGVINNK